MADEMNQNVAILSLVAALRDNTKELTADIKKQITKVEKNAGEIEFKGNTEDVQKKLKEIVGLLSTELKGVNASKYLQPILEVFSDSTKSAEEYLETVDKVSTSMKELASIGIKANGKVNKNIQNSLPLLNQRELAKSLTLQKEIEHKRISSEKAIADAKVKADNIQADSIKDLRNTYKANEKYISSISNETVVDLTSKMGIQSSGSKVKKDIKEYSELVSLFDVLRQKKTELDNANVDTGSKEGLAQAKKNVLENVEITKTLLSLYDQIESKRSKIASDYGVTDTSIGLPESYQPMNVQDVLKVNNSYVGIIENETKKSILKAEQALNTYVAERVEKHKQKNDQELESTIQNLRKTPNGVSGDTEDAEGDIVDIGQAAKEASEKVNDLGDSLNNLDGDKGGSDNKLDLWKESAKNLGEEFKDIIKYAVSAEEALEKIEQLGKKASKEGGLETEDKRDLVGYANQFFATNQNEKLFISDEAFEWIDTYEGKFSILSEKVTEMAEAQLAEIEKLKAAQKEVSEQPISAPSSETEKQVEETTEAVKKLAEAEEEVGRQGENFEKPTQDITELTQRVETLESSLSEMQTQLNGLSGEAFEKMKYSISEVKNEIEETVNKIKELSNSLEGRLSTPSTPDQTEVLSGTTTAPIEESIKLQDNLGREIDDNNAKLLKGTQLIDEQNKGILTLYHNSETVFDSFDPVNQGGHGSELGQGNYLAGDSKSYNDIDFGRYQTQWYAFVENIFDIDSKFSAEQIQKLINMFLKGTELEGTDAFNNIVNTLNSDKGLSGVRAIANATGKTFGEIFGAVGYDAIAQYFNGNIRQINVFDSSKIVRANDIVDEIPYVKQLSTAIETIADNYEMLDSVESKVFDDEQKKEHWARAIVDYKNEIDSLLERYPELKNFMDLIRESGLDEPDEIAEKVLKKSSQVNQTPLSSPTLNEDSDGQLSFVEQTKKAIDLIEEESGQMSMFETAAEKATNSAVEGQMELNSILNKNLDGQMTLNDLVSKESKADVVDTPENISDIKAETSAIEENTQALEQNAKAQEKQIEAKSKVKEVITNPSQEGFKPQEGWIKSVNKAWTQAIEEDNQRTGKTLLENYSKTFEVLSSAEGKVNEYKTQLGNLEQVLIRIKALVEKPVDITNQNEIAELEDLDKQAKALVDDLGKVKYDLADQIDIDRLSGRISDTINKNSAMPKNIKEAMSGLRETLKQTNLSKEAVKELEAQFVSLTTQMKATGKTGASMGDKIQKKFGDVAAYFATYVSIQDFIQMVRRGFETIEEYDKALTEMNKVSRETLSTLKDFQQESFALADSIGTTASAIQSSVADFMRLGDTLAEAEKHAMDANTLLQVSEFDSITEATSALAAMNQAWRDIDTDHINDVVNILGNNMPIATDELAASLQRSAGTLATLGATIEEVSALTVAGNAILQDPESVAAGLRTIELRMVGTKESKEQLSALGEDVDDFVVQTESKLRESIMNLTKVASNSYQGFDILDENGNYKSFYERMLGLAEIYEELQEQDKKLGNNSATALIELIAGKNRSAIAGAILSSPDILTEAYDLAMNAEGSAQEELEKQLESIEGHLNQLKNSWDKLWVNENNREVITFFLDLAKGILEAVDSIGVLNTALLGIGGFLGAKSAITGNGRHGESLPVSMNMPLAMSPIMNT